MAQYVHMIRKLSIRFFWDIILAILTYYNIASWHSSFVGIVVVLWFLIASGICYRQMLVKFFNFLDKTTTFLIGAFFSLFIFSALTGALIVFGRLNAISISMLVLVTSFAAGLVSDWAGVNTSSQSGALDPEDQLAKEQIPNVHFGAIAFLVLVFYGLYYLSESITGNELMSPWQTINPYFIYIFAAATLIVGVLVFSQLRARTILVLLIVYTFFLHAYLPFSHQLFYGADQWRHLAAESRIVSGSSPELLSVSPVNTPFFLTGAPGSLFYTQFWGLSVTTAQILQIDLIVVAKWLMPILWSVIFPLLIYNIGLRILPHKKLILLLIWLTALPFALQSGGSLTLPANLGFLFWLMMIVLLLARLETRRYEQIVILSLLALLSIFGYGLYLLLFLVSWALIEVLSTKFYVKEKKYTKWGVGILAVTIFPTVELLVGYSKWGTRFGWWGGIKQLVGNFSSAYLATGPRPHVIDTGNVIFNQITTAAFVSNLFTKNLLWLIPIALLLGAMAFWGLVISLCSQEIKKQFFAFLSLVIGGGYVLCRYFLSGANILTRRLDVVIAILFLILVVFAVQELFLKYLDVAGKWKTTAVILFAILCLSISITASYSLGPNLTAVSSDAFSAMKYVNNELKSNSRACVLADTYPLLTLEYLSAKNVSGGGFPFGADFSQKERVDLFAKMKIAPAEKIFDDAHEITGADVCYFVVNSKDIKYNNYTYREGDSWKMFGDYIIWKHVKKAGQLGNLIL